MILLDKLIDLVEKEIELYDKRPIKQRFTHPTGECYMNDIINIGEQLYARKENKTTKKAISRSNKTKRNN